jgi:rubrerythrin
MKKKIIIPSVIIACSIAFIACNDSTGNKAEMKAPVDKNETTLTESGNKSTAVNKDSAKAKTIADMQAAFKGETNATARYAAFSTKAQEEGHKEIAMLFKAASMSESIHANNHKVVLEEMGITVLPVKPEVVVKSTKENLEYAIKGEAYEVAEMYPAFLKDASEADNQLALISLNYAYKTEKKHKVFYEKALEALNANLDKALPAVYFVCPTCGNTYDLAAPKRCGVSMTSGERFIKISSL